MFRRFMIVCWTLFTLFGALALISWHYGTGASQRGDFYATQSFENGFLFGVIGAGLILVWNIIWYIGHWIWLGRKVEQ